MGRRVLVRTKAKALRQSHVQQCCRNSKKFRAARINEGEIGRKWGWRVWRAGEQVI